MPKINDSSIRLTGMDIMHFSLKSYNNANTLKEVAYHYNLETRVNEKSRQIIIAPEVKIFDKRFPDEAIGHLTIAIAYEVDNFDEHAKKREDGTFKVNFEVDKKIAVIALHTLRGVAFSLFKGTYLQGAILPIIPEEDLKKTK